MELAYLIILGFGAAYFSGIWSTDDFFNGTIKVVWALLTGWAVLEILILLGKVPTPEQDGLTILAWIVVGLAGPLGILWHSRNLLNASLKLLLLGLAVFSLVVAL